MKDVNKVVLLGRLGADPVKRETKKGISVTQFSLATSRRFESIESSQEESDGAATDPETESEIDAQSEGALPDTMHDRKENSAESRDKYREETQWHRIVAWGKQADACAQYLKTGSPVFVEGTLKTRRYPAKDGTTRIAVEVHAENVSFVGYPPSRAMQAIG